MVINKFIVCSLISTLSIITLNSQSIFTKDSLWTIGGTIHTNIQNVGLYNWSSGGESAISISTGIVGYMTFDNKINKCVNEINLSYALIHQADNKYNWKKTDDQLIINTRYGWYFRENWSFIVGIRLQTQFSNGYNYTKTDDGIEERTLISTFMSPCYIIPSVGIEYSIGDKLSTSLSPLAGRFVTVNNDYLSSIGAFDVNIGENVLFDFGINYVLIYKSTIMKNVKFENKFNLFMPYKTPGKMKLNWETGISMKVNKWLSPNITTNLIYDDAVKLNKKNGTVGPGTQFKYAFNLGFIFTVGDKK